jgi:sporulation protein YlmC with PRC-barrel domain
MPNLTSVSAMIVVAALIATPAVLAQAPSTTPPAAQVPTTTSNPALAVATVKLENGFRASRLIGAVVFNEAGEKIGSVDDLILVDKDRVVVAVVSVGGFLGIGSKLVAVPYDQMRVGKDKIVIPGANKDSLGALPGFTYSG